MDNNKTQHFVERRIFPRLKHKVNIKFTIKKSGYMHQEEHTADTMNISEEGLCIETNAPIKESDMIEITMELTGIPMELNLTGKVLWIDDDPKTRTVLAGIHIEEHKGNARKQISQFVKRHLQ